MNQSENSHTIHPVTFPAHSPAPAPPQLTEAHLRQLADARYAAKKIRRAAGVASMDGWTIAVCALLTFVLDMPSVSGVVIGLALGVIAFVELRAVAGVRKLDPLAARTLGFNQLALAGLIILYALWRIYMEMHGRGELASLNSDPEVAQAMKDYVGDMRPLVVGAYMLLIAFAILAQGSLAFYYFTRAGRIRQYLAQTPQWIIDMQRSGVPL